MHPLHSLGKALLSLGRGLAATSLAFTAACATTSSMKPIREEAPPVAAATAPAPVPVQVEGPTSRVS